MRCEQQSYYNRWDGLVAAPKAYRRAQNQGKGGRNDTKTEAICSVLWNLLEVIFKTSEKHQQQLSQVGQKVRD